MDKPFIKPGRLAIILGTAAFLLALPVKFGFDANSGMVAVKAALAQAKSGGDDDDNDDDKGGSGGGSHDDDDDSHDDDDSSDDSSSSSGSGDGPGDVSGVRKFEVSSSGVEVTYSDGTREEIENGRYERKNAAGQTVEQRPATQADLDRLLALR